MVCVVDATNLRRNLRLVLAVKRLGRPCLVALNMADLAESRGITIDTDQLSAALGVPVVRTVGIARDGDVALRRLLDDAALWQRVNAATSSEAGEPASAAVAGTLADHDAVREILQRLGLDELIPHEPTRPHRSRGAASGGRTVAPGRRAVPDVPGGIRVGRGADGAGSRARRPGCGRRSATRCPTAGYKAFWSTA